MGELQNNGKVTHASGDVQGTAPPGGALIGGNALGGSIVSLDSSNLASTIVSIGGYPSISPELQNKCDEIVSHIESFAEADFATGDITGICTNTVLSPGPLVNGAGSDGIIKTGSMNGSDLADAVASAIPTNPPIATPELIDFCTAIVDYIELNAELEYASGSVTATCPIGGGPITLGAGSGGTIL